MLFHDNYSDAVHTLLEVKQQFAKFVSDGEYDGVSFADYLSSVIRATLHGENDFAIIGLTAPEALRLADRIDNVNA